MVSSEEEKRALQHLQFLSVKREMVTVNIAEKDLRSENTRAIMAELEAYYGGKHAKVLALCSKIEMDLAQFSAAEARAFLDAMDISEPALNRFVRESYELLGLISFFTVKGAEVKAWTIPGGTDALRAAGKIHSDIARGFIKAEVVSFNDFISAGTMSGAREKGLLRLEGKTYEVKDGDIINFKFHV
jgi:ribosome-binding ATPase YchF (GTP1/OBG family)